MGLRAGGRLTWRPGQGGRSRGLRGKDNEDSGGRQPARWGTGGCAPSGGEGAEPPAGGWGVCPLGQMDEGRARAARRTSDGEGSGWPPSRGRFGVVPARDLGGPAAALDGGRVGGFGGGGGFLGRGGIRRRRRVVFFRLWPDRWSEVHQLCVAAMQALGKKDGGRGGGETQMPRGGSCSAGRALGARQARPGGVRVQGASIRVAAPLHSRSRGRSVQVFGAKGIPSMGPGTFNLARILLEHALEGKARPARSPAAPSSSTARPRTTARQLPAAAAIDQKRQFDRSHTGR